MPATGPKKITDQEMDRRVNSFKTDSRWLDDCIWAKTSKTPGLYYHGSPSSNISDFRVNVDLRGDLKTSGVFFTQSPTYAAGMLCRFQTGLGGRVYEFELDTRNPLVVAPEYWATFVIDREVEARASEEARANGFDALLTMHRGGAVTEVIVLDEAAIKRRGHVEPVDEWREETALNRLMLFLADEPEQLPFAEGCVPLTARPPHSGARQILLSPTSPIYADRSAWDKFDFEYLAWLGVDALADPASGDVIAVNPQKMIVINRKIARQIRSHRRKSKVGGPGQSAQMPIHHRPALPNETTEIVIFDVSGGPILDNEGRAVTATVYPPGTRTFQVANATLQARAFRKARRHSDQPFSTDAHDYDDLTEFFCAITVRFNNAEVEGAADDAAVVRAVFSDRGLGFIREQLEADLQARLVAWR